MLGWQEWLIGSAIIMGVAFLYNISRQLDEALPLLRQIAHLLSRDRRT